MKKLLPLLLLLALTYSCVSIRQEAELLSYTKSLKIDSTSEDEIYNKAIKWVCDYYNSPKDVINFYDREAKVLVINGSFKFRSYEIGPTFKYYNGYIIYSARMYFNKDRVRIVFSNFEHVSKDLKNGIKLGYITKASIHTLKGPAKENNNKVYTEVKIMIDDHINTAINDFTLFLRSKEDW